MAPPRRTLQLETLEARDVPSASPLVGVVRDGHDWFLAGDRVSPNAAEVRHFGQSGDRYLSGDWNGDDKADLIVTRPNAQGGITWAIDTDGDRVVNQLHYYGLAGDTTFVGDWNGDGTLDIGVARKNPQSGALDWYLDTTRQVYANPRARQFGLAADAPVVGDWDGNGTTDVGVTRPDGVTGLLQWSLDTSGDAWPEIVRGYGLVSTRDVPVTGDWNGDGKTDLGVTRNNPATGLKEWYLETTGDQFADVTQAFGFARDTPVVGAWKTLAPLVVSSPESKTSSVVVSQPAAEPAVERSAATPDSSSNPLARSQGLDHINVEYWDNRKPVGAGIVVNIWDSSGKLVKSYTTPDTHGEVKFPSLPDRLYRATVDFVANGRRYYGRRDGTHFGGPIEVQEVPKGAKLPDNRPVDGPNSITVTARDSADKNDLSGIPVRLLDARNNVVETYATNSKGKVAFWELAETKYSIEAWDSRKNAWVKPTREVSKDFGTTGSRGWTPKVLVGDTGTSNPPPLSGALKPGVYVFARDLDIGRGVTNGLTHQYVVLVPSNPDTFRSEHERDLGDGTRGIVIAAHNIDGLLMARTFNHADLQATSQYLFPEKYTAPLIPDYDAQLAKVNLAGLNVDDTIRKILKARDRYVSYSISHPLDYPSVLGQANPRVINSNSWAQSIIEYTVGRGRVLENFDGLDPGHQNRIPRTYFIG